MGEWIDGSKYIDVDLDCELNGDHHMGHILLESFRKKLPEDIAQIDGATDETESYHAMLHRIIRLSRSFSNYGVKAGDVIALSGTNHLDIRIPFHAGLMNGLPVTGIDPAFKYAEIKTILNLSKPKIAFCNYGHEENYKKAAEDLGLDLMVVTFLDGDLSMQKFIDKYDDNTPTHSFKPPYFDPNETIAWLMSTSGTTGIPKLVAVKQTTLPAAIATAASIFLCKATPNDGKQHIALLLSPIQWASAFIFGSAAILSRIALLTTSASGDTDHLIDIINKYRPNTAPGSPSIWALIMQSNKPCDLTCFHSLAVGGAKLFKDVLLNLRQRLSPGAILMECYGQTETIGTITCNTDENTDTIGSCGKVSPGRVVKLVDPDGNEITEPNVPGEMLYKGPMFDGYYKNPEETAKAFTEDGWLKTGDQLYRDENGNYYFVERLKMIIKFRSIHIIPPELEEVIRQHPGVQDVCVTSIDHPTDQQWPVAIVVKRPGSGVTAQEVKDIVAENLSNAKKLRGGVVFVNELPLTSTGQIARMEVRTIAATANRE